MACPMSGVHRLCGSLRARASARPASDDDVGSLRPWPYWSGPGILLWGKLCFRCLGVAARTVLDIIAVVVAHHLLEHKVDEGASDIVAEAGGVGEDLRHSACTHRRWSTLTLSRVRVVGAAAHGSMRWPLPLAPGRARAVSSFGLCRGGCKAGVYDAALGRVHLSMNTARQAPRTASAGHRSRARQHRRSSGLTRERTCDSKRALSASELRAQRVFVHRRHRRGAYALMPTTAIIAVECTATRSATGSAIRIAPSPSCAL